MRTLVCTDNLLVVGVAVPDVLSMDICDKVTLRTLPLLVEVFDVIINSLLVDGFESASFNGTANILVLMRF